MKIGSFLALTGIIAILFGIGFLFAPETLLPLYGASSPVDAHAVINARYFGTALLGWGAVNWFARTTHDREALRAVLIGNVTGEILGLLVTFHSLLAGLQSALGWSTVVIYALLAAGALYFLVSDAHRVVHG